MSTYYVKTAFITTFACHRRPGSFISGIVEINIIDRDVEDRSRRRLGGQPHSPRGMLGLGLLVGKLLLELLNATKTSPCRMGGPRRKTLYSPKTLEWQQEEAGPGHRDTSLSPHLATHSLAQCGQVTSPLLAWFLISNSEGLEQEAPKGASSSSFLMI